MVLGCFWLFLVAQSSPFLFGCFGGLIDDQYRNVVANRIDAPARFALQAIRGVSERAQRCLALRTDEDVEQIFRNRHEGSGCKN